MVSGIGSILELALRTSSCLAYVLNRRDLENRLWLWLRSWDSGMCTRRHEWHIDIDRDGSIFAT